MRPNLARRGKLILAAGVWFALVGAFYSAAPLIALGTVVVCAMMAAHLWFYPTAILLRRRKIELSWWVSPGDGPGGALTMERPFRLHLALRNHGFRALRVLDIRILGTRALEPPDHLEARVPAGYQVELGGDVRCHHAGYQVLHGAVLCFGDALGLFQVRAYFPNPIAIKVFPHPATMRTRHSMRPHTAALHERLGRHFVRRRGAAGELREIREHAHGDPFKFIAWKATARRQKLMVREHETEIVISHQLLVDVGGTMRHGVRGHTKLDYAIDTATALARAALDGGDRVGLVTFDTRVYSALAPGEGHHHFLQLVDRLIETHNIVDEDLTDVTTSELVAALASYLARQEAVDVRVRRAPPLDDPAWERIQAGPRGELYDLGIIDTIMQTMLKSIASARKQLAPAWWWKRIHDSGDSDPRLARIRLFCRLRGIELPYLDAPELGRRSAGLASALDHLATGAARSDVIVIVSDLSGLAGDVATLRRSLARARRGRCQVIVIAPYEPAFAPVPTTRTGQRVASVMAADHRARFDATRRLLSAAGARVLEATPRDTPLGLAARLSFFRSASGPRRLAR